ncbi:MAG: hypothetical protein ACOCUP_00685 [bacterium]
MKCQKSHFSKRTHILLISILIFNSYCHAQNDNYEKDFQFRADKILSYAADKYQLPVPNYSDPEKVYWPAVIARLHKYGNKDAKANQLLDDPRFKDKLPFHFILAGMAGIMPQFPDAPAMKDNKLLYLKNVAARVDSYNPWTCEGTENHINMSRTSGYIFAEQMLDYPDIFPDAEKWRIMMKDWLRYYARRVIETGSGEFNASTYGVFNIIGFLNLYDFAKDKEVKELAKNILDYYACELALHHFQGMTSGPESRGAPSLNSLEHETEWLSWLWFGGITEAREKAMFKSHTQKSPLQPVHAATSTYRPDRAILTFYERKTEGDKWYENSKPSYLLHTPAYIRHFLYQTSSYSLGSAMYPYGAFASSAYKNTSWKLISKVAEDKENPQMLTGGGGYYPDRRGKIRNPYTQLSQYRNVLVMMNLLPANFMEIHNEMTGIFEVWKYRWEEDFVKRFSAEDEKVIKVGNPVKFLEPDFGNNKLNSCYIFGSDPVYDTIVDGILFLEFDYSYVAIASLHQQNPVSENTNVFIDYAEPGKLCGLVLEVAEKSEYEALQGYIESYNQNPGRLKTDNDEAELTYQSMKGFELKVRYTKAGTFTEPVYDWGYGPLLPSHIQQSPPFVQPSWPEGRGHGRVPSVWVNGKRKYTEDNPPVYSGPYLKIDRGNINLITNDKSVEIND